MSLLLCRFLGIPLTPETGSRTTDQSLFYYLLSIAGEFRLQMHTTGLYVGVFGAVGVAGLLWVLAEKWQHDSEWSRHDVTWMISFGALLICSAIFYKVGTNSSLARRFAMAGTMADVLGVGVAVSVPVILWFRWQKPNQRARREDEDSLPGSRYSGTILGLRDLSPPVPPPSPVQRITAPEENVLVEKPFTSQPAESLEKTLQTPAEPVKETIRNEAIVMENPNHLTTNSQPQTSTPAQPETTAPQTFAGHHLSQDQTMSQPYPPQPSVAQPLPTQPAAYQPQSPDRPASPSVAFRDHLFALNNSWQRIESTGKEVEDWFQHQQRRVMAHLERPTAKGPESHMDFSRDFLEQRMDRVDAEWAAIRQTIREMHRWLENGVPEKETAPQETKVW